MANIERAVYENFPGGAKALRQTGTAVANELSSAYNSITEIHDYWTGKRYNELAGKFNEMLEDINAINELIANEIPYSLETVANNYSQADTGRFITTATDEKVRKIAAILQPNDPGISFNTEGVNDKQEKTSKCFDRAIDALNSYESELNKLEWRSDAATQFRTEFKRLKEKIIKAMLDIRSSFGRLMEDTKADIQKVENANSVKA